MGIPRIAWTKNPERFLQIYVDGKPYLRLDSVGHAIILRKFAEEWYKAGTPLMTGEDARTFEMAIVPPRQLGCYEIAGGGSVQAIDFRKKRMTPSRYSSSFHVEPNWGHFEELMTQTSWKFLYPK